LSSAIQGPEGGILHDLNEKVYKGQLKVEYQCLECSRKGEKGNTRKKETECLCEGETARVVQGFFVGKNRER